MSLCRGPKAAWGRRNTGALSPKPRVLKADLLQEAPVSCKEMFRLVRHYIQAHVVKEH